MDTHNAAKDQYIIKTLDDLRAQYKKPSQRTIEKETDYITPPGRLIIEASPLIMMACSGPDGADCSPKGDAPGFVKILDERTIVIPDRPGNNRLDGMQNLIENPHVGIIFMVPGSNTTYRVNGRAEISIDPDLMERCAVNGKLPHVVIIVHVEQAFSHCPKAFVRSNLWDAAKGGHPDGVPTHGSFAAFREGKDEVFAKEYDVKYNEDMKKILY